MVERDFDYLVDMWKKSLVSSIGSERDELAYVLSLKGVLKWREFHELYLMTQHWRNLRKIVLIRDRVCVLCGSDKGLCVDHKNYKRLGCESLDDLQLLCWSCHRKKTKRFDFGANDWYCAQARRKIDVSGKNLFQIKI